MWQVAQSSRQSSPSRVGSTLGKREVRGVGRTGSEGVMGVAVPLFPKMEVLAERIAEFKKEAMVVGGRRISV